LDKKAADAFIAHRMKQKKLLRHSLRHTRKHHGGSAPLSGAPLDDVTRQGVYLAPNSIPVKGHLPLSSEMSGGAAPFGTYIDYVHSGFRNPEDSVSYDPVQGQQAWPVPYSSTGSNAVSNAVSNTVTNAVTKGGRRTLRAKGGNPFFSQPAVVTQAFIRPITSSAPASNLQDMQNMWYGAAVGSSPDQIQRSITERQSVYQAPTV
jgi:hypothetical protein